MVKQRTPQEKKALDYELQRADHRGGFVNNNKSSRKAWPLLKARRSRQYRHAARRFLDDVAKTDEKDSNLLRSVPVRQHRDLNWGKGARLGDWIVSSSRYRVRRSLRAMLTDDYVSERDGARYAVYFATAMAGRSHTAIALAEALRYILAGPWPRRGYSSPHEGLLYRASSDPGEWEPLTTDPHYKAQLIAFFVDEPDWYERVRVWLTETSGDTNAIATESDENHCIE